MALSRRSSRHSRSRFTLVLLVLTSITVLTLDFRGSGAVDGARGAASTVFGPIRDVGAAVGRPFANAWNGVFGYGDLASENEALRDRIAELEGAEARNEDAARQLDEIAELNELDLTADVPSVVGRVTGGPITNFEHTIEVDRGTDDGVQVDMPVVTGAGLVGRVVQATPDRSVVQLVTDPGFAVGIRLAGSGDVGIAHGTGDDAPLVVDNGIDLSTEVAEGEAVTTSGAARSIFPPDIPVGRVASTDTSADQLSQELTVELLADLANLSYVRIVQWQPTEALPPPAVPGP
ncbi:MAG: rod shape-determining protein MreC [Acidimicrobiia bacterium]|nr:rod shape-determining protein MreC [Acidimicrobiia bacterium]